MTVRVEKSGAVTTVVHCRPEARNAMDPASADELVEAFLAFDADPTASVAVLFGEGGAFCSGWDLKYGASLAGLSDPLRDLAPRPRLICGVDPQQQPDEGGLGADA